MVSQQEQITDMRRRLHEERHLADDLAGILGDLVAHGGVMALEWWRRSEVEAALTRYREARQ